MRIRLLLLKIYIIIPWTLLRGVRSNQTQYAKRLILRKLDSMGDKFDELGGTVVPVLRQEDLR